MSAKTNLLPYKKKILFLIDSLIYGGGSEKTISNLSYKLSKYYNISLITFKNIKNRYPVKGNYYSFKENLTLNNKILKALKLSSIIRPYRIYKIISSIKPDVIISFTNFVNIFTIITKVLFRIKIPLIISIRCNPKFQYKGTTRILNFFIKRLYRFKIVDLIIAVSKGIQDILNENFRIPLYKLKTIYNGIDLEKITKMTKDDKIKYLEIFNNKNIFKFISVGRLSEEKGYDYLIKAFSIVKTELPESKLIIIGDGPLKNHLKRLISKEKLKNNVFLLGLEKNPFKYLSKSDIFILSSKYEGFPNCLIEALACGLPVISTNCEVGPNEILNNGEYGLLVKVMNIEDLSKNMIYLAKNPVILKNFSKKAIQRAKFFEIEKNIKQWIYFIEYVSIQ